MANVTIKNALKTSYENFAAEAYRRFSTKQDLSAVEGKVNTLIGSDADKSVRQIAVDELTKQLIPSNAKEAMDTLGEISAWLQEHPEEAAKINEKLTLGTHEVDGEQKQYDTVKAYVEAYVASQLTDSSLSGSQAISIANKVVSIIIDTANANGLVIGDDGLKLTLASASSAGTLSAADYQKFDGKLDEIAVADSTGTGNVITSIELDADGKTVKSTKGITALVEDDFEAITAAEVTQIFNTAKATVDAENQSSEG